MPSPVLGQKYSGKLHTSPSPPSPHPCQVHGLADEVSKIIHSFVQETLRAYCAPGAALSAGDPSVTHTEMFRAHGHVCVHSA